MLRFLLLCLLPLTLPAQTGVQLPAPTVDERVELVTIAFRLGKNNREYRTQQLPVYNERVDAHFGPYREHPLVQFINRELNKSIYYDAVIAVAYTLSPPPALEPLHPYTEVLPEDRWTAERAATFARLLRDFYRDTDAAAFFAANRELYARTLERFGVVTAAIDLAWYTHMFGPDSPADFRIVVGMGIGPNNYASQLPDARGKLINYAALGTPYRLDSLGLPVYDAATWFPVLLHEFNHSFVNPAMEAHAETLYPATKRAYRRVRKQMRRQSYAGVRTYLNEAVVRALVMKYLADHDYPPEMIARTLAIQEKKGFVHTAALARRFDRYDADRARYPDLASFVPEIAAFFREAGR